MERMCNKCGVLLVLNENWTEGACRSKTYTCRSCRCGQRNSYYARNKRKHNARSKKHYEQNKEAILAAQKAKYLWETFGLTASEYKYVMQDDCSICGKTEDKVLDHNHATGDIRGVLCRQCNAALGLFKDNRELLAKAIDYLGEYN